jgi:phosphatidate cytidylyltransferase
MADFWNAAPGDPIFKRRVLSALILGPIALALVVYGGQAFAIFVAAFAAAMAWEWVSISDKEAPPRAFALATGTAVGAALLASQHAYGWTLFWVVAGSLGCALDRRARGDMSYALLGTIYVSLSAVALVGLRNGTLGGLEPVLFLLAVVWAADTFAYLVGSWIGGPKLLPVASPNKTWAGLIAGLIGGVMSGAIAVSLLALDPLMGTVIAAPVGIAAVLGDLIMSLCKRKFGVKDAGSLIPGHGGVLDRVDALMLASLFAWLIVLLVPGAWPGTGVL